MGRNKILKWSLGFLRILEILLPMFMIFLIVVLLYNLLRPDSLQHVLIRDAFRPGATIGGFRICRDCSGENLVFLNDLSYWMKIWILIRSSIFFILYFLIIRSMKQVITSVRSKETFYAGNVRSFRKLARYGLIVALFASFNFLLYGDQAEIVFAFPFGPLAFTLGCLVLSLVFEEGKQLNEDQKSIV